MFFYFFLFSIPHNNNHFIPISFMLFWLLKFLLFDLYFVFVVCVLQRMSLQHESWSMKNVRFFTIYNLCIKCSFICFCLLFLRTISYYKYGFNFFFSSSACITRCLWVTVWLLGVSFVNLTKVAAESLVADDDWSLQIMVDHPKFYS